MARRTLVIQKPVLDGDGRPTPELEPLGTLKEVLAGFARFNTAPDSDKTSPSGSTVLHGPGFVVELLPISPITQAMVSVKEQDIAFAVLWRVARAFGWKILDPETGQQFG